MPLQCKENTNTSEFMYLEFKVCSPPVEIRVRTTAPISPSTHGFMCGPIEKDLQRLTGTPPASGCC